ncbi:uncharacterized protein BXIN_2446 [Babesia sp. Xinjiang]|uniref:uncharacterized protein n=1 Tax=Babesia sp. Xinjiang TaxID=462227 RepID=UPI000A24DC9A|nr:uncharacterized protein BXIN_2446 [Babesia sp. Xinjiang]ORM41522.1 hypothetical protein BXIN_2446 [Babesia sp. Xinjiang]
MWITRLMPFGAWRIIAPRSAPVALVTWARVSYGIISQQKNMFSSKAKKGNKNKVQQKTEVEDEDTDMEYFDINEHLDKIVEIEEDALKAIADLKPVAITLDELEAIPIKNKMLVDLAQIVMKSPIVTHIHVFDVKIKSKVVRELVLLRDDWTVHSDDDDLIVIRMPSPNSAQLMQQLTQKAHAIVEAHQRLLQRALSKANAKIKQVNIGNNWHRKQQERLDAAAKRLRDRMKTAVKELTTQ